MIRNLTPLTAFMLCGTSALAQVPSVATDIAPIQSLVAQVMGDLGTPTVLMEKGASPHSYALRPSDAKNLQRADVVIWTGDALAPWLGKAIDTLADGAVSVPLLENDATITINFRTGTTFDEHDHSDHASHGQDDDHHDAHGQDHHGDERHEKDHHADGDHAEHSEDHVSYDADHGEGDDHDHDDSRHDDHHSDDYDDHHGDDRETEDAHAEHDHSGIDPHAWLDPLNAVAWLDVIADTLSDVDPENAQAYADNAAKTAAGLVDFTATLRDQLADEADVKFVVFHDAYHYFETRFGLAAMGAISLGDAAAPSPARISELQHMIAEKGVDCVMAEPQFNPGLVKTLLDGTSAQSRVIDPLGQGIPSGPGFYTKLIQGVADSFDTCR